MSRYWNAFNASQGAVNGVVNAFKQGDKENALRAYAANPSAPGSMQALARYDPALAIQTQNQQSQQAAATEKEREERATKMLAGVVQSIDPADPTAGAKFDQALDQVAAMGFPEASELKGKFSPQVRAAMMAAAGINDQSGQPTAFQKDALAAGIKPGTPEFREAFEARQIRFVPGPTGTDVVDPRAYVRGPTSPATQPGGGPQPGQIEDGFRFKGGDPARPENWEPVDGGPTPRASGGFQP